MEAIKTPIKIEFDIVFRCHVVNDLIRRVISIPPHAIYIPNEFISDIFLSSLININNAEKNTDIKEIIPINPILERIYK